MSCSLQIMASSLAQGLSSDKNCTMTVPVAQMTYFDSIGNLTYRVVEYSDGSIGGGRCYKMGILVKKKKARNVKSLSASSLSGDLQNAVTNRVLI